MAGVTGFHDAVSPDANAKYPAEKGRYAIYVSAGCPWAHRVTIVRALKKLEDVIEVYILSPSMNEHGWFFDGAHNTTPIDPIFGSKLLREVYLKAEPNYTGRFSAPVFFDKKTNTIVNNESSEIVEFLASAFDAFIPEELREVNRPGGGLYPANLRKEIDEINKWVYENVNIGVYNTGLAETQESYDKHLDALFGALDRLEGIFASHGKPYVLGDSLTLADVRLYPTIVRFDTAYHTVFLTNLKSIRHDYPNLNLWLRRLYWANEGFHSTTAPWIDLYSHGYATARARAAGDRWSIVPRGPAVPVEPLLDSERI